MRSLPRLVLVALACLAGASSAAAADLTLPNGGRVTLELLFSDAAFRNTLAVRSPGVAVDEPGGCRLEPAAGLQPVHVLSAKPSQAGCRIVLDAAPGTSGVQPFAAGTTLQFELCAQADADFDCEFLWSSDPAENSDGFEHVQTTPIEPALYPGRIFRLAWEDQSGGGDLDFDDLIVMVRVDGDFDGDGLWDDWEQLGVDADGDGAIDLDLPALGADPTRKDLFLEIDYMSCSVGAFDCPAPPGHSHRPKDAAIALVVDAFANAPVPNPDGSMGINLHVDVDDALPHQQYLALRNKSCNDPVGGNVGSLDDVKANPAYFGPDNPRRFAYHYAVFGHSKGPDRATSSGCAEGPGNDFLVSLGDWNTLCVGPGGNGMLDSTPGGDDVLITGTNFAGIFTGNNLRCDTVVNTNDASFTPVSDLDGDGLGDMTIGTLLQQAGTLMHEFGHNLGLFHGGDDDDNNKPNYRSVMNYSFQTRGVPRLSFGLGGGIDALIDYSATLLPPLDETSLEEPDGIQAGVLEYTRFYCPNRMIRTVPAGGAIDWNCDGDGTDTNLPANVNDENGTTQLDGFRDWSALRYELQNTGAFDDGSSFATETPEELPYHVALEIPLLVEIDVTPAEVPNAINPRAKGTVPVAILSAADFRAPEHVATASLRFGRTGEEQSLASCNAAGEDVDGDGRRDLVCHFTRRLTGFAADSTIATLRGQTVYGAAFDASAPVKIVAP